MAMKSLPLKKFFFLILALVALAGSATNTRRLFDQVSIWPLARLVGYGSLLAYSLLMLCLERYNTPSFTEEEK